MTFVVADYSSAEKSFICHIGGNLLKFIQVVLASLDFDFQ